MGVCGWYVHDPLDMCIWLLSCMMHGMAINVNNSSACRISYSVQTTDSVQVHVHVHVQCVNM